jgi:hypothetical protein
MILATGFLKRKMDEYEALKVEIDSLKFTLKDKHQSSNV